MDPTTLPQAGPVPAQGTPAPGGQPVAPVETEAERKLNETKREAQTLRARVRELEAAQTTADQARAAQETAALVEQNKFKELYEASERKATEAAQKQAAAERKALIAQVAQEAGLPAKAWDRVQGDDEAAIRKDITENLLPLMVAPPAAPVKPTSGAPTNGARPPLVPQPVATNDPMPPSWTEIFKQTP